MFFIICQVFYFNVYLCLKLCCAANLKELGLESPYTLGDYTLMKLWLWIFHFCPQIPLNTTHQTFKWQPCLLRVLKYQEYCYCQDVFESVFKSILMGAIFPFCPFLLHGMFIISLSASASVPPTTVFPSSQQHSSLTISLCDTGWVLPPVRQPHRRALSPKTLA